MTTWDDLKAIDSQFVHSGERARYISFPLGGIGSGGLAITGSGRLMDWSIQNRPGLQTFNGYSHFAIKAEAAGQLLDARVLNGPYDLNPAGSPAARRMFDGFGHGANRNSMAGLPHFSKVDFYGRFPTADLTFEDEKFPGAVRLTAFSPFVPHQDRDSSMPVAAFAFEVVNTTDAPIDYTIASTIGNYGTGNGRHTFDRRSNVSVLHLASAETNLLSYERGDISIATDAEDVEHTDYHYRGQWFDDLTVYWREFARPGRLPERHYDEPRVARHMHQLPEHGTLAGRVTVAPGERKVIRFVVSWSFPEGEIYWFNRSQGTSEGAGKNPTWRNYYSTQWADSRASARDMLERWDTLAAQTVAFRDALFDSTLPREIVDAASSTMALLRTATVIRLGGGDIWAWEGQHTHDGSCEGSCTHVWNYQQALAFLFPALERTLRETEFTYNQLPSGGLTFRQRLPIGAGFDRIGPCADGHWGAIIKTYRDWKLCGNTDWLRRYWPNIRRAIEFAWSPENPDLWDPEKTGILWGRQHHTLDMELFGPNSWLSSMYVAALKAGSQMAAALGDEALATECNEIAERGTRYLNEHLFNGEFFYQGITLSDQAAIADFAGRAAGGFNETTMQMYWSTEHNELKYQIGSGCLIDQILGQWHADIADIEPFLDPEKVTAALKAVYRHNFRRSFKDHVNPARVFAYEDEGGVLLCTWPDPDSLPMVPAPYSEEVWTGLEYMTASHMIMRGMVDEGLEIVRTVRARYNGTRRNPWSEIECGSYYARSMSAYQLINAYSGQKVDATLGRLKFDPVANGPYRLFWSAGEGWGQLERTVDRVRILVLGGQLELSQLDMGSVGAVQLPQPRRLKAGDVFEAAVTEGGLRLLESGAA